MIGADASAFRAAAVLLSVCGTTQCALTTVLYGMESPGANVDWWLRVYYAVEDLGVVRDALGRAMNREQ